MGGIPMIQKYRNEGIVLLALILFIGGFLYEKGMAHKLEASLRQSRTATEEITQAKTLRTVWSSKGLKSKVASLQKSVNPDKIKTFDLQKSKLNTHFLRLSGRELNTLTTRIASLPVRIQELAVTRAGSQYTLRCTCAW